MGKFTLNLVENDDEKEIQANQPIESTKGNDN